MYRVYYNRTADEPWLWSVDEGTQESERQVTGVRMHGCDTRERVDLSVVTTDKERPRAWMEVDANLMRVDCEGVAHFFGRWVDSGYPLRPEWHAAELM